MSASGPEIVEWRQKVAEPPTLQPSQVEVVVALDESTARECYHIRHEVFANEMGMTPSTSSRMLRDRFDGENRTVNLLALCDGEPAAATRLILPRSNTFTDFPLEQLFRLEGLPRAEVAELPSSAVLARFRSTRRLIATLWTTTAAFARDEYGIEVLVAGVNIGTDDLGEGLMVFTALTDQGATHPSARAIPLTPHT
ncbi:MAG: Acetyltransferase domain [Actinomycetota bacterium]|nr:Acetyltransferase domain [Actinomycetota bacterium]